VSDAGPLSVSEVTLRIKQVVETEPGLAKCEVRGEVSNFKRHTSGHLYFSLKDEGATLGCVMWRGNAQRLRFDPKDGEEVLAAGSISVYPPQGKYQLVCDRLEKAGKGDLWAEFEALKRKLEAEGLFDPSRKRPIPQFPGRVAVISSATGAATQDMLTILARRYPPARVVLIPATVQGEAAPASLLRALGRARRVGADVILLGRGGGSMEDLWCFNDEALVRAVAASHVPVIAAVGHETDFTLTEFAADLRAPTPSAAAEMAVPDRAELRQRLHAMGERLRAGLVGRTERARLRLEALGSRAALRRPLDMLVPRAQRTDDAWERLARAERANLQAFRARCEGPGAKLEALSPGATMARGYAVCTLGEDGRVLRSIGDVDAGDPVRILLPDGRLEATVDRKE
jgi:exodeoxyribonuclease VII large subunit